MPLQNGIYLLDGDTLTIEDLSKIINENLKIGITVSAWKKVQKSRNAVELMMSDPNKVVYGINTGFGNFADKIITPNERAKLQINLIRSHSVGVGQPLKIQYVKRMFLLRINTLCKGRSGISPINLKKYIEAFNKNYIPMIPEKGTVGASGDLAPLSHLALGMMGEGLAWDEESKAYINAEIIMKNKKLQHICLQQKQGLALINGTQFMSSIISSIQSRMQKLFESAFIVFLFAVQTFGLETQLFFNKDMIEYYSSKQKTLGLMLKKASQYIGYKPSQLNSSRRSAQYKICSSYSIMQALQNFTAVFESMQLCKKMISEELNSTTDNPLVFLKEDGFEQNQLISAGNFHGEYIAKASDFLSMALFSLARFSQARIEIYVNERISNLPGFLANKGGLNSGFMIIQYTSAALLSESKVLVKPASADSISTSASQQDHVSMGGYAARKCEELFENVSQILGIQLLYCLQAIDMIKQQPSQILYNIHQKLRKKVPYFEEDTFFGPYLETCKQIIQSGLNNLD